MKAHLIDTHLLVLRSRSSAKVKVKYQGHVSQKMGISEALVFHKHILLKNENTNKRLCTYSLCLSFQFSTVLDGVLALSFTQIVTDELITLDEIIFTNSTCPVLGKNSISV